MQTKLLINGNLVKGEGSSEDVLDPATGKTLAKVAEASRGQIDAAVKAADAAFDGWSRTPPKDRAALLLKLADRIEADGAAFAKLESQNCGKPLAAALGDEIPAIADVFRFFAGACRTMTGAVAGEYLAGYTSMIRRDPVGGVAKFVRRFKAIEAGLEAQGRRPEDATLDEMEALWQKAKHEENQGL